MLDCSGYLPSKTAANVVVIVDEKSDLLDIEETSAFCKALQLSRNDLDMLKEASKRLSPGSDFGDSVELLLPGPEGNYRRFALGALPNVVSRHNTPSKPHALGTLVKNIKGSGDVTLLLRPKVNEHAYAQVCSIARQFPMFSMKSNKSSPSVVSIVVDFKVNDAGNAKMVSDLNITVTSIRLAQRLVDSPTNVINCSTYVAECRAIATEIGCAVTVIEGKDLLNLGAGGLWGVGMASEFLPAMVILSRQPSAVPRDTKSICLVGKGIVYDTGGLSIKTPTTSMAGMKTDMGGSAAALGAFIAAVKTGNVHSPLHCILCIAENSVGPLSMRPDDILTMLSGKTVEVNNTDAEGRLVLSDGCFYAASKLNAGCIIDIATLTGAQLIATGKNHGAIYCNDEWLEDIATTAGKYTGDLVFPVPYCPEFYRNEFRSVVADMKNSVADRGNAQTSCAAQFIGNHIEVILS